MKQPEYSPLEALERIKLMMKYDMSKTLNENKEVISEQYVAPSTAAGLAGAGVGAGLAAQTSLLGTAAIAATPATATAWGTAAIAGTGPVAAVSSALGVGGVAAGAIIGGAAALAVLPLVYWLVTKDTGANKVKKMFEMC